MIKRYFNKVTEVFHIKEITNIILIGVILELLIYNDIINFRLLTILAHSLVITPILTFPMLLTIIEIKNEKIE